MNRTARTNDRTFRTAGAGRGGGYRSQAPSRTGSANRSGGYGRRPAVRQGEFALPVTMTPALPAAQAGLSAAAFQLVEDLLHGLS